MSEDPGLPFGYQAWCSSADGRRSKLLVGIVFDDVGRVRHRRLAEDLLPDELDVLNRFIRVLENAAEHLPATTVPGQEAADRVRGEYIKNAADKAGLRGVTSARLWTGGASVEDQLPDVVSDFDQQWDYHEWLMSQPLVIGGFLLVSDPPSKNIDRRVGEFKDGLQHIDGVDDLLDM